IMLLRPAGDTDDPDSPVNSVFLDFGPARSRQLGPEDTSVPVRLGPTIDDDEWLTLEYGEAVRWDPESVLHIGDSHTATLSLGDYSRLTPQALLRRGQFLSSSAATEGDTDSNDSRSATAFNTEINRRVSAASSDCQSSLGNSSPKSRKDTATVEPQRRLILRRLRSSRRELPATEAAKASLRRTIRC
ncbi:hypothetical protein FOZ63_003069, partial [Perkinsus olseni]